MINDRILTALVAVRVDLLFNAAWYGQIATRLELTANDNQPAIKIDRWQLQFNREYVQQSTPDELREAICHQIDRLLTDLSGEPLAEVGAAYRGEVIAAIISANRACGLDDMHRLEHIKIGP